MADTPNPSSTVNIAPNGDVVLVVGKQKAKLRVYSAIMRNASPVFEALMGPRFKEGQSLLNSASSTFPIEIPLPDDDPVAMEAVCNGLHHRHDRVVDDEADALKIAIQADKYDCWSALQYVNSTRLTNSSAPKLPLKEQMRLMAAAYLFNNASSFQHITRKLILEETGDFLEVLEGDLHHLPHVIIYLLEKQRAAQRAWLLSGMNEFLDQECRIISCDYHSVILRQCHLQLDDIFHAAKEGIKSTHTLLLELKDVHPIRESLLHGLGCNCYEINIDEAPCDIFKSLVLPAVEKLEAEKGLCLRCLKDQTWASVIACKTHL